MAFVEMPGVTGLVYTPDEEPAKKKSMTAGTATNAGFAAAKGAQSA